MSTFSRFRNFIDLWSRCPSKIMVHTSSHLCFSGGYQDYQDRSPNGDFGGGRGQDSSSGFGNEGGFQQSNRKDSDDWGNNWDESGWSEPSPKKESSR